MRGRARIEWERDGVEGIDGVATRQGFDGAIFVEFKDRRCSTLSALLHAGRVAARRRRVVGGAARLLSSAQTARCVWLAVGRFADPEPAVDGLS